MEQLQTLSSEEGSTSKGVKGRIIKAVTRMLATDTEAARIWTSNWSKGMLETLHHKTGNVRGIPHATLREWMKEIGETLARGVGDILRIRHNTLTAIAEDQRDWEKRKEAGKKASQKKMRDYFKDVTTDTAPQTSEPPTEQNTTASEAIPEQMDTQVPQAGETGIRFPWLQWVTPFFFEKSDNYKGY